MVTKMSKYMTVGFALMAAYVLPVVALAQSQGGSTGLRRLVGEIGGLIQGLIPIVIGLALLVFLWGVLRYVIATDDAGKSSGRTFMLWGIIALFVMVSVWGLVNILRDSIGLNPATPPAPGIPTQIAR
ncbi:MAG: hypothetical protein RL150_42 [Candidatus Parcubacteria bacterium]|jgi:hypothetical protein